MTGGGELQGENSGWKNKREVGLREKGSSGGKRRGIEGGVGGRTKKRHLDGGL